MSRLAISRLPLLVVLLATVVYSTQAPVNPCWEYGRLVSRPLAEIFVVDLDSVLTRAFFRYARCWLSQRGRVRILDEEDDYSQLGANVEFVMHNFTKKTAFMANFEQRNETTRRYGYTLLQPCEPSICDGVQWKMDHLGKNIRVVNTYKLGYKDSFAMIVTGLKNPSYLGHVTPDAFDKQSYEQMVRLGLMVVLVTFFTFLALAICCHSLWTISMIYDDFDWRRDHMDNVVFQVLREEELPMRSPNGQQIQTALSRTNSAVTARSRSSASDFSQTTDLDGTQFSRTEKTAMED